MFSKGVTQSKVAGVEDVVDNFRRCLLKVLSCRWRSFGRFPHCREAISFSIADRRNVGVWELSYHFIELTGIFCIFGRLRRLVVVLNIKQSVDVLLGRAQHAFSLQQVEVDTIYRHEQYADVLIEQCRNGHQAHPGSQDDVCVRKSDSSDSIDTLHADFSHTIMGSTHL